MELVVILVATFAVVVAWVFVYRAYYKEVLGPFTPNEAAIVALMISLPATLALPVFAVAWIARKTVLRGI